MAQQHLTRLGTICLGMCLAFVLAACGGSSDDDALPDAEEQIQDAKDALDSQDDGMLDGFREESETKISTGGDQVEMPPEWPGHLNLPTGFVLDNTNWLKDGTEQTIVGTIEGAGVDEAAGVMQPWVEAGGYTDVEVSEYQNPIPTTTVRGQGDGDRIEVEVRESAVDPGSNLVVIVRTVT